MMKKITTLLLIVFFTSQAFAQFNTNWSAQFQYTTSPGYSNEARKIVVDGYGSIFMLADITSNIDSLGHPVPTTQYYAVLRKLDANGHFNSQRIINVGNMVLSGGHDLRASFGLELDPNGNVFVGCSKYNFTSGNFDVVVNKYNGASLNLMWSYGYATAGNDYGVDMKFSASRLYCVIRSVGPVNTTYKIVKVDVNVPPAALYSFDPDVDVINSMVTNGSNFLYLTGYRLQSGVKTAMTACVNNNTGALKWKSTYNHGSVTGEDFGTNLMIGTDGEIYVSGTTYTNATDGNDGMLLKYNHNNGNLMRQLAIDHTLNDFGYNIANGPSGYLFEAMVRGNGINVHKVLTNTTGMSVSNTAFYSPIPSAPYTSLTGATISDMKVAASNNIYVCGNITGTSSAGNFSSSYLCKIGMAGNLFKLLNYDAVSGNFLNNSAAPSIAFNNPNNDIIALRNNWSNFNTHSTEMITITNFDGGALLRNSGSGFTTADVSEISFYPNPASGSVNIITNEVITLIELCDLTGKVVATPVITGNTMDISGFAPGIFFARVITPSGTTVKKIIIK